MYNIFSRRNCIFHINNSDLKKINTSTYKPLFYMKKKEKKNQFYTMYKWIFLIHITIRYQNCNCTCKWIYIDIYSSCLYFFFFFSNTCIYV